MSDGNIKNLVIDSEYSVELRDSYLSTRAAAFVELSRSACCFPERGPQAIMGL